MTVTGRSLPDFLSDLTFSIGGNTLQAFPMADDPEVLHLKLEGDSSDNTGVFVRQKGKTAEVKCSQAITRYQRGKERVYGAWDPHYPTPRDAEPFKEWVRNELIKDIDRMLSWHIERHTRKYPIAENTERYLNFCKDFAELPDFEMNHPHERSFLFKMLGSVHRVRQSGVVSKTEEANFAKYIQARDNNAFDYTESLAESCFNIALCLLPTIPAALQASLEDKVATMFEPYQDSHEDLSPQQLWLLAKPIVYSPKAFRDLAHPQLLKLCTSGPLSHVLAAALKEFPQEAELYIQHGLSLKPESISLLIAAETFYLQTDKKKVLANIRARISALGVNAADSTNVQEWIDRYTHLANDFQYFKPQTNSDETAPELLELETKLNQHWMKIVPERPSLARAAIQQELIEQSRFLSAGSGSVVGWLRNQHRYQEVVDYMMPLQEERELCLLRHKSNPRGFEGFLSNGLSCFLDSQKEEHIVQALQLVNGIEDVLSPWKYGDILYALGCIAARAGQTQRALTYVRQAIEKGESIEAMAKDPDFQSLWENPDFIALR